MKIVLKFLTGKKYSDFVERTKINDYEESTTWYDGGAYPLQDAFFASSGTGHITKNVIF